MGIIKENIELVSEFRSLKEDIQKGHEQYVLSKPEFKNIMADYVQMLLLKKPENVYEFTRLYFSQ